MLSHGVTKGMNETRHPRSAGAKGGAIVSDDLVTMGKHLEGFFARRAHREADAQDLAQETMVRALAKWGQLRQPGARRAWVFSIAHNLLRDHRRAAGREEVPVDAIQDLPDVVAPAEWQAAIREAVALAMATLPAQQRRVLLYRLFDDLSFAEVGRRLGVPEATARTRAYHGLRRLRAAVASQLRQGGWLVECEAVRERLLRMAFGLSEDRAEEETKRHLAACSECRREVDVLTAMWPGAVATDRVPVLTAGWALHDVHGNATSYWLTDVVNHTEQTLTEWDAHSSWAPDVWKWFDGDGRRLEEASHWRGDDSWAMRLRLNEPCEPGARLRVVGAAPMHLGLRSGDGGRTLNWYETPLPAVEGRVHEIMCRRALQLPAGYRAAACDPEPDHSADDGALLTWSMVVPAGERLRLAVTFAPR